MKAQRRSRSIIAVSLASVLCGGGWLISRLGRFTPTNETRYPLCKRLGGPQGKSGRVRRILSPPGFEPRTVQPIASRCIPTRLSRAQIHSCSCAKWSSTLWRHMEKQRYSSLLGESEWSPRPLFSWQSSPPGGWVRARANPARWLKATPLLCRKQTSVLQSLA
jgi:hypothetical protein